MRPEIKGLRAEAGGLPNPPNVLEERNGFDLRIGVVRNLMDRHYKQTNTELNVFVKSIKKNLKDAKIYLFGSRAKGNHLQDSNFNVIVVSNRFEKNFFKRIERMLDYWNGKQAMDVLCYTPEEFKEKKKGLNVVSEAMKTAKVLV